MRSINLHLHYITLWSETAALWLVYRNQRPVFVEKRPGFCWLWVSYDQAVTVICDCVQCETDQAQSHAIHSCDRPWIVHDSKARPYAEDNRTESNCMHTGKLEAKVTNNKNNCAWGIVLLKHLTVSLWQQSFWSCVMYIRAVKNWNFCFTYLYVSTDDVFSSLCNIFIYTLC